MLGILWRFLGCLGRGLVADNETCTRSLRVLRISGDLPLRCGEFPFEADQRVRQAQLLRAQTLESASSKLRLYLRAGREQACRSKARSRAPPAVPLVGVLSPVTSARPPSGHGANR